MTIFGVTGPPYTRGATMRLPTALAVSGTLGLVLLHVRDPHGPGSYGLCPFNFLTGLWCPGCGGLRAVNDLTTLDLGAAVSSNVLAVVLLAALGAAYLAWLPRRWRGERARLIVVGPRVAYWAIAVIVLFTTVRNTPWGASLAP